MPGNVHVLYGEEFSAREALEALKSSLGPREELATNTLVFDGRQAGFGELEMACNTVPFMAERRLVVVEGLLERFEERGPRRGSRRGPSGAPDLGEWSGLGAMAQRVPATTVLALLSGPIGQRNPLLAQLGPVAQVRQFMAPRGEALLEWSRQRVARYGGQTTPEALRLLATMGGDSLRQLDADVQKLCLYARGRAIQEVDVRNLVTDARQANIFALVDALAEGRRAEALRALRQLTEQGAATPYILTMLARQVRMMVIAKSLHGRGASEADIARALGTGSDFVVRRVGQQTAAYTEAGLKEMYARLLHADLSIKSSAVSEELVLEALVAETASAG